MVGPIVLHFCVSVLQRCLFGVLQNYLLELVYQAADPSTVSGELKPFYQVTEDSIPV